MIHEAGIVLHGGQSQITLLGYVFRVVLHLLAFAATATTVYWCFDVVTAHTAAPESDQNTTDHER